MILSQYELGSGFEIQNPRQIFKNPDQIFKIWIETKIHTKSELVTRSGGGERSLQSLNHIFDHSEDFLR